MCEALWAEATSAAAAAARRAASTESPAAAAGAAGGAGGVEGALAACPPPVVKPTAKARVASAARLAVLLMASQQEMQVRRDHGLHKGGLLALIARRTYMTISDVSSSTAEGADGGRTLFTGGGDLARPPRPAHRHSSRARRLLG